MVLTDSAESDPPRGFTTFDEALDDATADLAEPDSKRMRALVRECIAAACEARDILPLMELMELDLPQLMPGDQPAKTRPQTYLYHYGFDGEPLDWRTWAALSESPEWHQHHLRYRFHRAGRQYTVSTIWLGIDVMSCLPPAVPLFWETMIFTGKRRLTVEPHQWRYGSWAAACHGHRQIVAAIRAEQARRRAPRPPMRPRGYRARPALVT